MVARAKWFVIALLVLLFARRSLRRSKRAGAGPPAFTQQELDQILAPIALYPDALLSQIMMAATYPREVVEAAHWSRRNPDLNGDRAVRAVERIRLGPERQIAGRVSADPRHDGREDRLDAKTWATRFSISRRR